MRRHYVYYRVAEAALPFAVAAVRALQTRHGALLPADAAALWRRPGLREDGCVTLMEVWQADDAGAIAALEADARRAFASEPALAEVVRHVEVFDGL